MIDPLDIRVLRLAKTQVAVGTSDDIEMMTVPLGEIHFVNWVTFVNNTTNFTRWGVWIKSNEATYRIGENEGTKKETWYALKIESWLREHESLFVRCVGATTADVLTAYVNGHYYELRPR